MGIALPKTIVEGRNRTYVLAAYALIFGVMLPGLVGRWWFGNREKTKDGVNARSAAAFFKSISEESTIDEVVASLGKSFEWERPKQSTQAQELDELEKQINKALGAKWNNLKTLAEVDPKQYQSRRRAFILLYAHLLRLPVLSSSLRSGKEYVHEQDIQLTELGILRTSRHTIADTCSPKLTIDHHHIPQLAHPYPWCDATARVSCTGYSTRRKCAKIGTIAWPEGN